MGSASKLRTVELTVRYGDKVGVADVSLEIPERQVLALIGPSGCGKSTFLRALNRMNDGALGVAVAGRVELDGVDVYGRDVDPVLVRRRVGMVFQRPNPFPKSIYENVAYGLRIGGRQKRSVLNDRVEHALGRAGLWDEVKDRLHASGTELSGGQQQRLCLARALAVEPEVILMDEPASALDPIATERLESLIKELGRSLTVVIVTHNLGQARRVSERTAFFYLGKLIEVAATSELFEHPQQRKTQAYLTGGFG